jgi:hypothetical protein
MLWAFVYHLLILYTLGSIFYRNHYCMIMATPMQPDYLPGGYFPVSDIRSNEHVQNAAQFAFRALLLQQSLQQDLPNYSFMSELNGRMNSDLSMTVVRGKQQVVAGMNYILTVVLLMSSSTSASSTTNSRSDDVLGAFDVTVYDQFGQLSVTGWGSEISHNDALSLLNNFDHFDEKDANSDDDEKG